MNLNNVFVTQNNLRHWSVIPAMVDYVASGGFWTVDFLQQYATIMSLNRVSPRIQLSRFEDGKVYIHDGHHRCTATVVAGRDYLREDEFVITDWTYDQYLEINPASNWYTPFDPRIHQRLADISEFKKAAAVRFKLNAAAATDWIRTNHELYRRVIAPMNVVTFSQRGRNEANATIVSRLL